MSYSFSPDLQSRSAVLQPAPAPHDEGATATKPECDHSHPRAWVSNTAGLRIYQNLPAPDLPPTREVTVAAYCRAADYAFKAENEG